MKVNGIVAEYNPFHNGHAYQMQHAKEATGADYTIIVMSGNFMQRGAPALLDKFTRAKMALEGGADLVLELPTCYAASSAEFFAKGSVALFDKLGVTTNLCFGSECGNIDTLSRIAEIFYTEPEPYVESLRCNLKKGMSQPNMLFAFAGSIDDILFISPARSTDYLLLISDKEGEKRYRIVPLDMLEKSMSIQPKSNLVLVPEKGIFVFAEILIPELVNSLDDEKSLQDTFDQYCAGRLWEHNSYIKNVDKISNLCNVPF